MTNKARPAIGSFFARFWIFGVFARPVRLIGHWQRLRAGGKIPCMSPACKIDAVPVQGSLATVLCLVLFSQDALAYFDPATGSILLQGLLAGLAGAALTIKLFFARIKSGLKSMFSRSKKGDGNRPGE